VRERSSACERDREWSASSSWWYRVESSKNNANRYDEPATLTQTAPRTRLSWRQYDAARATVKSAYPVPTKRCRGAGGSGAALIQIARAAALLLHVTIGERIAQQAADARGHRIKLLPVRHL
jgi:hypothetical protein